MCITAVVDFFTTSPYHGRDSTAVAAAMPSSPIPPRLLDQFVTHVQALINQGPQPAELNQQLRALVSSAFGKLDLVTRDEFEAQQAVLLRTREKVEALEKQLESLTQAPR